MRWPTVGRPRPASAPVSGSWRVFAARRCVTANFSSAPPFSGTSAFFSGSSAFSPATDVPSSGSNSRTTRASCSSWPSVSSQCGRSSCSDSASPGTFTSASGICSRPSSGSRGFIRRPTSCSISSRSKAARRARSIGGMATTPSVCGLPHSDWPPPIISFPRSSAVRSTATTSASSVSGRSRFFTVGTECTI